MLRQGAARTMTPASERGGRPPARALGAVSVGLGLSAELARLAAWAPTGRCRRAPWALSAPPATGRLAPLYGKRTLRISVGVTPGRPRAPQGTRAHLHT